MNSSNKAIDPYHVPIYGSIFPDSGYTWDIVELVRTNHHILSHHALVRFKHELRAKLENYSSCMTVQELADVNQSNKYSIQDLQILLQLCILSTGRFIIG